MVIRAVRALSWLLSLLPAAGPQWLSRRFGRALMLLSPGKRAVAQINLRRCYPQLGEAELRRRVQQSFEHYLCSVLETGRNWYWPVDRLRALCDEVTGREHFEQALQAGRGVVLLAPHFGAWEYLAIYLPRFTHIAILYKPPSHPGLHKALVERRNRGGGTLLPATVAGLRRLFAEVRAGRCGGLLPDQQPSEGEGRFAPFFGVPALTGILAWRLVQRTGCRVFYSVCERRTGGRYRVHLLEADEGVYSADVDTALAAINRGVERCIAIDPAQYLWSYRRFRIQPEGQPVFYG